MCAYSMTGFGRGESRNPDNQVITEIKSVNNRFKDFRFRMPALFSATELDLREIIQSHFSRGSFEISIQLKKNPQTQITFDLDEKKIEALLKKMKYIANKEQVPISMRPVDFLRSEFMLEDEDKKKQDLIELMKDSFMQATEALKSYRAEEGKKLLEVIKKHVQQIHEHLNVILGQATDYTEEIRNKLLKRIQDFNLKTGEVDQNRMQQEIIYYLEKIDIDEEINRIKVHLQKMQALLDQNKKEDIGRNIDFLIQELNREVNTIGSKSSNSLISDATIGIKIQLEKIREQALNLE